MRPLLATLILASTLFAQADKPPAALTSAETKQAEGLLKEYFAAKSWEEKEIVADKLTTIDHPSKSDISSLSKKAFALAKQGPRVKGNRQETCTDPDLPGQYLLDVPSGAKRGQPTGVFISLHGGGQGEGDAAQIQGLFGTPGKGLINVYPTVIEKTAAAWNEEKEERYVLAILEDLKRTYTIDTNRVYLAGHSMGGYGTWSIGPRHADLFASISAMAGGIFVTGGGKGKGTLDDGILPNLKNLPIWFYNSEDDKQVDPSSGFEAAVELEGLKKQFGAFDFVAKHYPDIGHGTPKEGLDPIWKWMLAKKRDPLPKRVLWEPSRSYKRHFYWLRCDGGHHGEIDVARDGNKFTVTGDAGKVRIMVNEKMIKFDQPVSVKDAEGKELWSGKVPYSLVAMLESIEAKRDPEMWFSGWIDLGSK